MNHHSDTEHLPWRRDPRSTRSRGRGTRVGLPLCTPLLALSEDPASLDCWPVIDDERDPEESAW